MSTHGRGSLLAVAGVLCWSLDGLLFRIVSADPFQIIFWRMISFALTLGCMILVQPNLRHSLRDSVRVPANLAIALFLAGVNVCFVLSVVMTTVANALVIFSTVPLFSAIFGLIFLSEPILFRTKITIMICLTAVVVLFGHQIEHGSAVGETFAIMAAIFFAGSVTMVRAHPKIELLPSFVLAGIIAAVFTLKYTDPLATRLEDIFLLSLSGSVQQTCGLLLFFAGAKLLPPAHAGLFTLVETIAGPVWVWIFLGEAASGVTILVAAIILSALAFHTWRDIQNQPGV